MPIALDAKRAGAADEAVAAPLAGMMRLRLLGQMTAQDDNGPLSLPKTRKTRAVLAILALAQARPVLRDHITSLLWSTRESEQARASLRQSVHELQTMFAQLGVPLMRSDRHILQLGGDGAWIEVLVADTSHTATATGWLEDLIGLDPAFDHWLAAHPARHLPRGDVPSPQAVEHLRRHRLASSGVWLGVAAFRTTDPGDGATISVGLAEEITTALARFRWMNLIAPASIAALADEPAGQTEHWADLGLDFLLDGSIQRSATHIRVTVRLLDMHQAAAVVWSQRFDCEAFDLFKLQDDIAAATAAQLDPELMAQESKRAATRPLQDATAYELMLRAIPAIYHLVEPSFSEAGRMLAQAADRAPDNAMIHAWWACWHGFLLGQGWAAHPDAAMAKAGQIADRALALDPQCARALSIAGYVRSFLLHQDIAATIGLHERALQLNPHMAFAWAASGLSLAYAGEHATAVVHALHARRLSPFDPHGFFFDNVLMVPSLMLGDFDTVVAAGRRSLAFNPAMSSTCKGLLAALGHLGRHAEARDVLEHLLRLEPGFSLASADARSALRRPVDRRVYLDGLRLAGLR